MLGPYAKEVLVVVSIIFVLVVCDILALRRPGSCRESWTRFSHFVGSWRHTWKRAETLLLRQQGQSRRRPILEVGNSGVWGSIRRRPPALQGAVMLIPHSALTMEVGCDSYTNPGVCLVMLLTKVAMCANHFYFLYFILIFKLLSLWNLVQYFFFPLNILIVLYLFFHLIFAVGF